MNQVILVGRLTQDVDVTQVDDNKKKTIVSIAVNRGFKNIDGIYETDFFRCTLWNGIASSVSTYCQKGDVIGIKGRLQATKYEDENNKTHYITEIIAERVTFLSSNKKVDEVKEDSS